MNETDTAEAPTKLSLGKNMLWNSVGSIVYLAAQWLITVVVVRLSNGFDAAGALALGMSVSNIFTPIGQYKIRPYQVSDVEGDYTARQYIAHRILTMGIAFAVMIIYALATCPANQLEAIYLYGAYSFGPIFADVLHGEDQRADRMDYIGVSYILRGIASITVFSLVLWQTNSLELSLVAMTVVTFALIAIYDVPKTRGLVGSIKPDFNKRKVFSLFKTCAPAVLALLFCSAVPAIPRQVLSGTNGADALGIYASVAAPVLIVQMGAQYVYSPMLTEFARRFRTGDVKGFSRLLLKVTGAITLIAGVGVVGFELAGAWLLDFLYGNGISEYTYTLPPLVLCTVLTAYVWFIGDLLIVIRDMKGNLITYGISMIVCLLSMYVLISEFGMNGVSYTVILSFGLALVFAIVRIAASARSRT